ncbi:class I SAM-dependent methyltransferase [Streptomyces sp. NPDC017940]|uniref:class I SAM-dependent methyltransferase n=1 Tax=Streptomyces sp. NPDC017940 TaxID=3365017 RepID=UPI0037BD47FD
MTVTGHAGSSDNGGGDKGGDGGGDAATRGAGAGHRHGAAGHGHGGDPGHGHEGGHGHGGHGGHGHGDIDWAVMAPVLEQNAEVTAPVYREVAAWLRDVRTVHGGEGAAERGGDPSLIVDAGSGPGVVSCLLAEAFPASRVIAADPEEALLARAAARATRLGLANRVGTHRAELPDGLGELAPADLIWAARSVHHVGDQVAALTALADRLAPGGVLAILEGGLAPRSLPRDFGVGRPGLQARLDAANEEWFTRMRAELPGAKETTEHWPALLAAAGLRHVATRSFLLDLPAPLDDAARAHVVATFQRYRDFAAATDSTAVLTAEDLATLDRLLDPQDEESLHRRADLYLLTAHTVHVATTA